MKSILVLTGRSLLRNKLKCRPNYAPILQFSTRVIEKPLKSYSRQCEMHNKTFSDVVKFINEKKDNMNSTHRLFPVLIDDSLPARTRMSFVPHMMSFSLGAADFLSSMLRVQKPEDQLTIVEKQVNTFVNEDDFHYNYYIRDLEALGYSIEKFGNVGNVLRHIWSHECLGARKVIYNCNRALGFTEDPLIRMTLVEIFEAGLFQLFTSIYENIIHGDNDLPTLEYFGETHVSLEANHEVTSQFSGKDDQSGEENAWKHEEINEDIARACHKAVKEIMTSFELMYDNFYDVIQAAHKGQHVIHPSRFEVVGDPRIRNIIQRL